MIGNLVGLSRAAITSPMPNKRAMEKAIVNKPLIRRAMTMLRGTTTAESLTSSPIEEVRQPRVLMTARSPVDVISLLI